MFPVAVALLTALVLPASAVAAPPTVATGGAARVTQTSATLTGSVTPNGRPTVYFFEYGPTARYGARTPDFPANPGRGTLPAAATLEGLTAATRYQYRLVARNQDGTRRGANRSFRTPNQPLGVTLAADANPVTFGTPATIRGTVTGTGGANQPVVLQARGFPFTSPWADVAGPARTDAAGSFVFSPIGIPATTQYQVRLVDRPGVGSPVLSIGVGVKVATYVKRSVRRGGRLLFTGTIRPARAGAQVAIQKRTSTGTWSVVAGTITRGGGVDRSRFAKRVRIPRGGTYRVLVALADGNLTTNTGTEVRIRTRR
jgi:hypothetical protein